METKEKLNLTMLCDFYELTMGNGYFQSGLQDRICYFDMFFASVRITAASPSQPGWSRSSTTSRICILIPRTWRICKAGICFPRNF